MANAFVDSNKMAFCPYDKNHSCLVGRLNAHLVKCRKNHPDVGYAICDYNHDHRVPKLELNHHHTVCQDRIIQQAAESFVDNESVMEFPVRNLEAPVEEVWEEDELNHTGYDGEQYAADNNILRTIAVEQPAVRRQFRREEQQRMNVIRTPATINNVTSRFAEEPGHTTPSNEPATATTTTTATTTATTTTTATAATTATNVPIDEDKPELSLIDRIHRADTTVYQPAGPADGFQKIEKKKRKPKKE